MTERTKNISYLNSGIFYFSVMTKTDGCHLAQGERTKPSFEYKPVPNDEENTGQSDKDLGARWGLGENSGPHKAQRRPSLDFPGGLRTETVPDGTESQ